MAQSFFLFWHVTYLGITVQILFLLCPQRHWFFAFVYCLILGQLHRTKQGFSSPVPLGSVRTRKSLCLIAVVSSCLQKIFTEPCCCCPIMWNNVHRYLKQMSKRPFQEAETRPDADWSQILFVAELGISRKTENYSCTLLIFLSRSPFWRCLIYFCRLVQLWQGPCLTCGIRLENLTRVGSDTEFVQKFTPPDFKVKILHCQFHLISTVLVGKTQKLSKNGEIYTAGKNFTLPPAVTAWTNSTSVEECFP